MSIRNIGRSGGTRQQPPLPAGIKERRIVEIASYSVTMARLGDRVVDLALATVGDYLRFLAHSRPIVRGGKYLRQIDTRAVIMADGTTIPSFTVWYQIKMNDEEVQLLAVTTRDEDS